MIGGIEIKVCGLTSPEDAVMAVEAGADALGFIFYSKSPRKMSPQRYKEMSEDLPSKPRVAVTVIPEPDLVRNLQDLGFERFQIHFPADTQPEQLETWSASVGFESLCLAPKIPPEKAFDASVLRHGKRLLWDSYKKGLYGGTGRTSDWEGFARHSAARRDRDWILAGGLGPENVLAAMSATGASRIDLNSGIESSPGKKDAVKLRRVQELLQNR